MKARLYLALVLAPFALMCSSATQGNGTMTAAGGGTANMVPSSGGSGGSTTTAMGISGGSGGATTTTGSHSGGAGTTVTGGAGGGGGAASAPFNLGQVIVSPATATVDTNGDGIPDGVPVDTNGDGLNDSVVTDTNGDGIGDQLALLVAGNGGNGGASAGGAGGTGGATGSVGGSSAGGSGNANGAQALGPTAGCQAPDPMDMEQTWLEHDIMVANLPPDQIAASGMRRYWVRLPVTYDHTRAYPIVFYGPGCGASGVENTPMMDTIKNDAIHVFLLGTGSCFDTGGYPTPEVPYFNQVLDEVQARYCTDASKVFVSGYSSGGWLSHDLACGAGNRIRGIGSAAGGLTKSITDGYDCSTKPPVAAILYTGANDNTNPANSIDPVTMFNKGVAGARDRLILANGCDMTAMEPWPTTLAGVNYCTMWKTGCEANPVVYCVGPGDGHGNGGIISSQGWWEFWSSLP